MKVICESKESIEESQGLNSIRLDCEYPYNKSELESFESCCFNDSGVLASLSESPLFTPICYRCGEVGHIARYCYAEPLKIYDGHQAPFN